MPLVVTEDRGPVRHIVLNRPEKRNAFNDTMILELRDAAQYACDDPDVRVVSEDFVGNYLELRYGARANAYVDDRPDARTLLDYKAMRMMEPDWQQALDRADADVVVFQTDRKFTTAVARLPEWTVVTTKGSYTVLCRDRVLDCCR